MPLLLLILEARVALPYRGLDMSRGHGTFIDIELCLHVLHNEIFALTYLSPLLLLYDK